MCETRIVMTSNKHYLVLFVMVNVRDLCLCCLGNTGYSTSYYVAGTRPKGDSSSSRNNSNESRPVARRRVRGTQYGCRGTRNRTFDGAYQNNGRVT